MNQSRAKFIKSILIGSASIPIVLEACKKENGSSTTTTTTTTGSCSVIPEETEGPYPYVGGEITNPLNRSDIRTSSGSTVEKTGVPLSLTVEVVNTNSSCAAIENARVDIWHCDARGYYSGYASQSGVDGTLSYVGETWLRGYQLTGTDGKVTFTTIYPGWYGGRATHIHIEVYVNNVLKATTQIAFLETISDAIQVTSGYDGTVNPVRNASDSVFGDSTSDYAKELITLTGSISAGYSGTQTVGIAL
jgi:protocatechuate 3,4-dioxygenase beta subunit